MNKKILSTNQQAFLALFSKQPDLAKQFTLSGGTALASFYIPYRYSEDLDFFSLEEVDVQALTVFLRSISSQLSFSGLEQTTSFNRNLFFLKFPDGELKLEFTYYPFSPLEPPAIKNGIYVDSLIDIAVNKLFTIYQKPRSRDFMDLYVILKQEKWTIEELIIKAKYKFDWHVDPIQLGSQFLKTPEIKDYPRLIEPFPEEVWQNLFLAEAKKLGKQFLS